MLLESPSLELALPGVSPRDVAGACGICGKYWHGTICIDAAVAGAGSVFLARFLWRPMQGRATRRDEQDKETQPALATTMATQAKARSGTLSIWEMLFRTITRLRFYPAETYSNCCFSMCLSGRGGQALVLSKSWVGPDPDFGYARPGALSKFWVPLGSDSHFGSGAHAYLILEVRA